MVSAAMRIRPDAVLPRHQARSSTSTPSRGALERQGGALSRRGVLAGLAALSLPAAVTGHAADGSLSTVVRTGQLRFALSPLVAVPPPSSDAPDGGLHDPFSQEFGRMIAERIGVDAVFTQATGLGDGVTLIGEGRVDAIMPTAMTRRTSRQLMLTAPYVRSDMVLVGRARRMPQRLEALGSWRVAAFVTIAELAEERSLVEPGRLIRVPSLLETERRLLRREVDAAVTSGAHARSLLERFPMEDFCYCSVLMSASCAISVRFGADDLLRLLNICVAEMLHDGRLERLALRFTGLSAAELAR
jgi:ABC-type amino acid transport substrate-binding protein